LKHIFSLPLLALFGLVTPAQADFASFETAFVKNCLQALPDMKQAITDFESQGWSKHAGANGGEFEYYKNGTAVFLTFGNYNDTGLQSGCTIVDETVSLVEVEEVLDHALDKYFDGQWHKENGNWGLVWLLPVDTGTVVFSIQEDLSGNGGGVSFELRP